jgi:hypothetical protein
MRVKYPHFKHLDAFVKVILEKLGQVPFSPLGEGQDEGRHPHSPPSRGQALALSLERVSKSVDL